MILPCISSGLPGTDPRRDAYHALPAVIFISMMSHSVIVSSYLPVSADGRTHHHANDEQINVFANKKRADYSDFNERDGSRDGLRCYINVQGVIPFNVRPAVECFVLIE